MKRNLLFTLSLLATVLIVVACTSAPNRTHPESRDLPQYSSLEYSDKGQFIVQLAHSLIGTPYRYGGSTPEQGFDCSGLVFFTHINAGDKIPRSSFAQLDASKPIDIEELQPGDLLFYRINSKPSHVGIYIGDKMFIHAPSSGKKVSVASMDNPYFKPRLIRAGRLYR
ncbi:MAG: C40 family peptidase [Kangiellaceae bacterium]|nr:C40 family peptidase [Kangiellaceae bacterium]